MGQMIQADFFENTDGLNLTDSPFAVKNGQASDGQNFDYIRTGGIRKRKGYSKINSVADAQLRSLGIHLRNTNTGTKTIIRAAGTKIQLFDRSAPSFTNLTEDTTTASSEFLTSGSTQSVVANNFNTATNNVLWLTGGGMTLPYGVYSDTKVTQNGTPVPTGSISTSVGGTGGVFAATGTYYYAVAFRKASTQALSNAALDISATISATTEKVTVTLSSISNVDTTKYDKIYLYRSAVSGTTSFTSGVLVAQITTGTTSYIDDGSSLSSTSTVPRAGGTLDNSVLSSATYKYNAVYKRRLVVASNNTIYFSDLNKPESWPTANSITLPSGGDITGLSVISINTPSNSNLDEVLAVFKETECWLITGNDETDITLKFVDNCGTLNQSLVVPGNGYISFLDRRGIYIWDGAGKPIYVSRPIEALFAPDGDIDLSKLSLGYGVFNKNSNTIRWVLSHKTYGENEYSVKMDIRLTMPRVGENLMERIIEGVFTADTHDAIYAGNSFTPANSNEELFFMGDASGFIYYWNYTDSDIAAGTPFKYRTKFHDLGSPGKAKRFHKVIAWVDKLGTWDLTLKYWTNYRSDSTSASSLAVPISTDSQFSAGVWDVGYWEDASPANNANTMSWDDYTPQLTPVVFNLSGINSEGDCIMLEFSQETAENPVTINSYSIIYSEISLRK